MTHPDMVTRRIYSADLATREARRARGATGASYLNVRGSSMGELREVYRSLRRVHSAYYTRFLLSLLLCATTDNRLHLVAEQKGRWAS